MALDAFVFNSVVLFSYVMALSAAFPWSRRCILVVGSGVPPRGCFRWLCCLWLFVVVSVVGILLLSLAFFVVGGVYLSSLSSGFCRRWRLVIVSGVSSLSIYCLRLQRRPSLWLLPLVSLLLAPCCCCHCRSLIVVVGVSLLLAALFAVVVVGFLSL